MAASLWALASVSEASSTGSSTSSRFCDRASPLTATQQDRLLRFAAVVRQELDASDQGVALVARSGLDLSRFGARYSHAGVSLKASDNGPWSVRQLYYACDESRPRLYDQGMAGFLLGVDDPALGYVSIIWLPPAQATQLERSALDRALALRLLGGTYSANAYPFSLRYQNCNQWVMELLATSWGGLDAVAGNVDPDGADVDSPRGRAQRWLIDERYTPSTVAVGSHLLMWAAPFIPWVHLDDHPQADLHALQFRISMPASIEAFVHERLPGAQRIELCHDERQIVIRHGWAPIGEGCRAGAGDRVVALD